jgi:hypothetical protein
MTAGKPFVLHPGFEPTLRVMPTQLHKEQGARTVSDVRERLRVVVNERIQEAEGAFASSYKLAVDHRDDARKDRRRAARAANEAVLRLPDLERGDLTWPSAGERRGKEARTNSMKLPAAETSG